MYWQDLNMTKFKEIVDDVAAVIIPIGMTEAHGPHCPFGTDNFMPAELSRRINDALGDKLVIAPSVPYGHSWSLAPFAGTIDIPAAVFSEYVLAIGRGILKQGIKRIVFLNGHGGNIPALTIAAETLADEGANVFISNWWLDYSSQILNICEGQGHAGEDETSVMLALVPNLVDMSVATANSRPKQPKVKAKAVRLEQFDAAMTGDGTKASAEKGRRIIEVVTELIIKEIEEFITL